MVHSSNPGPCYSQEFKAHMVQFFWPETVLFLVLLAASAYGFWWRFGKVWRTVLRSKKDPDFHIRPIGRRVWDFIWEVMLQGKVIRERRLPGLAHAFVFWGFCAFALVTLNHIAIGFGMRFLAPGSFYFPLAAVFAVLVSISISGFFIRRFILRPKWLGELS